MGNTRSDAVAYGPGRDLPGREFYDYVAKYRLGRAAGPSMSRRHSTPSSRRHPRRGRARCTSPSAPAASRAWTSCSRATASPSSRRSTPSRASRPSACSRACRAQGGFDFADICERIVRARPRAGRPAPGARSCAPTTCRERSDAGAPARTRARVRPRHGGAGRRRDRPRAGHAGPRSLGAVRHGRPHDRGAAAGCSATRRSGSATPAWTIEGLVA